MSEKKNHAEWIMVALTMIGLLCTGAAGIVSVTRTVSRSAAATEQLNVFLDRQQDRIDSLDMKVDGIDKRVVVLEANNRNGN